MKKLITRSIGIYLNTLAIVSPSTAGKKSFDIFCYPVRPALNEKQKEYLTQGASKTFRFKDVIIQTYRWGNGDKKVLLLHGWQSHTYRWKVYIDSLVNKGYTVLAIDAPGHGLSTGNHLNVPLYSEAIEAFIQQEGELHAVVSHSIGSFSILYTFHRIPDLPIGRLVTLAPPGEASSFFDFYRSMLGLSDRAFALTRDHFVKVFNQSPEFFSAPAFAKSVTVPGLIIHDETDEETPIHYGKAVHQAWEKSKLIITKGFGHNLRSHEVTNEVVSFVGS